MIIKLFQHLEKIFGKSFLMIKEYILHSRNHTYMSGIERDKLRVKETAEVFTPTYKVQEMLDDITERELEAIRKENELLKRQIDAFEWDKAAKGLETLFDKVGGFFSGPKKESKPKIPDAYYSTSSNDYKQKQIDESIRNYSGSCPCPYSRATNGSLCGKRSAWSKPGGQKPKCYFSDL